MEASEQTFKNRVHQALGDKQLKKAIERTAGNAERNRLAAVDDFPEFQKTRQLGRRIKDHVISNLGFYLKRFEKNAIQSGAKVHWARNSQEASQIVVEICKSHNAKSVTRSKSMLGEEIGLPHALEQAGIERVETDLAEHIVQLADERPSHIIWPAMHKTREEVIDLFKNKHKDKLPDEATQTLVRSARKALREKFLNADIGISGANFLVADSGAICTVTNEGNAELTTTPPKVHIVTAGIEKLVPSIDHAWVLLRLLVRSATGADFTQYTTFHCGPKRDGDADGPEEFHIVLVDNGRTKMLSEGLAEMLRCIRCGACMNHCVVYRQIGGHAYGGTYPGPMGTVITPAIDGIEKSRELAHACTMNGKCAEVCPVEIPLPTLIRGWRDVSWSKGLEPPLTRVGIGIWAFLVKRPWAYHLLNGISVKLMRMFSRKGKIKSMPFLGAWTKHRDFPAPQSQTFLAQYQKHKGNKSE